MGAVTLPYAHPARDLREVLGAARLPRPNDLGGTRLAPSNAMVPP
ncbi:hypothetical protein [Geothrix sp. 21YS21S-2]|nr:hypothetical protein [Geothrix sp. 21YS21S-2]